MGKEFESIVAMAPKKQIKSLYLDLTSTGNKLYLFKSTPGTMAQVISFNAWFIPSVSSTSGGQILDIGYKSNTPSGTNIDNLMFSASVPFNAQLKIVANEMLSVGATALRIQPADLTAQAISFSNLYFGATDPQALRFEFRDTGTPLGSTQKYIWITYIEEEIR